VALGGFDNLYQLGYNYNITSRRVGMKKTLMVISLAILFCFTFGCQDKEAMAELEAMKAQAEVEEQNKEVVKSFLEAWYKGDFEAAKELSSPDFAWYSPSNAKPMNFDDVTEKAKMVYKTSPDFTVSLEEIIAKGDKVVVREISQGTYQGGLHESLPTGNEIEVSDIAILRIENGKIAEVRKELDSLGGMMQLGMELKPKEEK
jgi:predicted ester cyclase